MSIHQARPQDVEGARVLMEARCAICPRIAEMQRRIDSLRVDNRQLQTEVSVLSAEIRRIRGDNG